MKSYVFWGRDYSLKDVKTIQIIDRVNGHHMKPDNKTSLNQVGTSWVCTTCHHKRIMIFYIMYLWMLLVHLVMICHNDISIPCMCAYFTKRIIHHDCTYGIATVGDY